MAQAEAAAAADLLRPRNPPRPLVAVVRRVVRSPNGAIGLGIVALLGMVALFAPQLAPYDPIQQYREHQLAPPGGQFLLGTDELGRDLLSRLIHGTRIAFSVALIAVGVGTAAGAAAGLISGYFGGMVDVVLMRLSDVILTFPGILVGIAVVTVLGPGSLNVAWALAVGLMPTTARLMRSKVLSEREREYVMAARASGARDRRIILLHILPNSISPLLVTTFLAFGFTVLSEAALSFLQLGTQPPDPSWGAMLNSSRAYLRQAPWYGIWPGLALALLIYGLNSLSDALRDALDPRRSNL